MRPTISNQEPNPSRVKQVTITVPPLFLRAVELRKKKTLEAWTIVNLSSMLPHKSFTSTLPVEAWRHPDPISISFDCGEARTRCGLGILIRIEIESWFGVDRDIELSSVRTTQPVVELGIRREAKVLLSTGSSSQTWRVSVSDWLQRIKLHPHSTSNELSEFMVAAGSLILWGAKA
ncbi:hypothetical protein Droror1_Dr00024631 [Drosera rotundifolia]